MKDEGRRKGGNIFLPNELLYGNILKGLWQIFRAEMKKKTRSAFWSILRGTFVNNIRQIGQKIKGLDCWS
jgi:methanogenic corrinoid protein MtbC1